MKEPKLPEAFENIEKWDKYVREGTAGKLREALTQILRDGHCNDTCSHMLSENLSCDCWKAKVRAALLSAEQPAPIADSTMEWKRYLPSGAFFHPDSGNVGYGWTCVWETVDGKRLAKPLDYVRAAQPDREQEFIGYDLAGCADRAGVIVCKKKYPDMLAADWNRFAAEVRAALASQQGSSKPAEGCE